MIATAAPPHVVSPAAMRAARRRNGLTLHDVGARVGRAASVIARYERGEIDPPGSVLGGLAVLYGVSVADFYRPGT